MQDEDIGVMAEGDGFPEISDEEQARIDAERERRLAGLSLALKKLRDEAVTGRASSGIEAEWLQDEEYYQGTDEANRAEKAIKPTSPDGRVIISQPSPKATTRSTVFVNITRPYVDAASARVGDMLLPSDDRNYAIRPTPIPDMIRQMGAPQPGAQGMPQLPGMPVPQQPVMPPQVGMPAPPVMAGIPPEQQEDRQAKQAAELAQRRIDDWLTQCRYHAEVRQVIDDAARLGIGILKGPFPESVRSRAVMKGLEGTGVEIKEEILPRSRRVDPWNFYPDPSCGERIQNGKYVFERDDISARQLQDLARNPEYQEAAILRIIEDGPKSLSTGDSKRPQGQKPSDAESYEIWYYHGYLSAEDLESAGCECDGDQIPVIVTMVNDEIIKAAMAPLDSGEFPYDVMIWQRRQGFWAGIGVARQMRTEQDGVNAATRMLMDNAGVAAKPIPIFDRSKIEPISGSWVLGPGAAFMTRAGEDVGDVRQAVTWIVAPMLQVELAGIIQFWQQRAEDVTGLPMLLQGQMGKAPDTVGGMTMLNNNASAVLRRIARNFDDRITEPHIGRYYEWLLLHGKNDAEKGDFTIDARGSTALFERDQQSQALMQMVQMSLNPAFGLDPELVLKEAMKGMRIDPKSLELSAEKKQRLSQPPPDPRIGVAQIHAQVKGEEIKADAHIASAKLQAEKDQRELDAALREWEKKIDATIEAAKLDGDKAMHLDAIKSAIARDTMKLRTQIKLSGRKQVMTPPTEPSGRAPRGHAFQK